MTTIAQPPSDRTRVRRIAERGLYDRDTIHRIIDEAWHCHVAFADDKGVNCIPTAVWRRENTLHIHGSNGSRMLRALIAGAQACVTITHLDGLVLARSAFHHSMNYRSAIIYGSFAPVPDTEKNSVLEHFMRHIANGRERQVRPPDRNELAATTVLAMPITEAAAKIRAGGPKDDEADMSLPVWAGVIPLREQRLAAVRDASCDIALPEYLQRPTAYSRSDRTG